MTTQQHTPPPGPAPIPPGFVALADSGGPYMHHIGPLYRLRQGDLVKFGFRVERRHVNPLDILHGGMMASFCDMLLPLSVHDKSAEVADRFLPTISLQIDYLAAVPLGAWVEGQAQPLRVTRSLVFAQGLVSADGIPCARTSGVFKIGPALSGLVAQ
ncbi:PaaI family thioesterase [Verminephrobacter eiseniae]|uniref:Thioesterase superfamily protein n=1 Tax=Verminephrobacter eiseniae (strain EF01-2) TaxID=391735 RepID=A1WNZ2_VEREI|nr:PaaI family thioesterase [Verminephrobacter eiseniae]ABM59349.1 thioesterase superfamily protein [Verminephrobacter eiseniae EF01-2]MCW5259395.1 PaaI family thioesterase [Verminephrobacter eiseniae]MCW5284877.1 PaaI family thioesterase [Verminephrobacter eiseniae]MCW5302585.1 PaaI family thioesterase [Verminephrobacter eiseniae]MCW8182958.1 PaaI family thioesterase [Verminephrobacter eiseniae]